MLILYRISPHGYKKQKLESATKEACLRNMFMNVYRKDQDEVHIFVDNGDSAFVQMVLDNSAARYIGEIHVHETSIGSSGQSFRHVFEFALSILPEQEVYFLEDDYIHVQGARRILLEGLERAPYVSGYDHPDKYIDASRGGNPLVQGGGEITQLIKTNNRHWKITNSTTMTFLSTTQTLQEDRDIILKHCKDKYPTDYDMFTELAKKGRALITPIPGVSTHAEEAWLSPFVNWNDELERTM